MARSTPRFDFVRLRGLDGRHAWARLGRVFRRDVWERDADELGPVERPAVQALRLVAVVVDGFARHRLTMRAGALTYITIFSLVPVLAVAFAMVNAFGGVDKATELLLPRIVDYLAVGVREQFASRMTVILENVNGGAIGATGFVFVVMAVVALLSSMEDVFNEIWGVKQSRSYFQRLTIYWTVVTIAPALLLIGVSLPALARRLLPLRWVLEQTGTVELFFARLLPLLFICTAFALMYAIMTHTRVPPAAAVIGGLVAGVLWSGAAFAYGWYARTTVYYANVYGPLSAIPIFVFWLYISWVIVLTGAQVAFATQNLATFREEIVAPDVSQAAREIVALRIMAEAARAFLEGRPPPAVDALPRMLRVSGRLVNQTVDDLIALGFLRMVGEEHGLVPCRDPASLRLGEVVERLRAGGAASWSGDDALLAGLAALHADAEAAGAAVWAERSFADVVPRLGAEQGTLALRRR